MDIYERRRDRYFISTDRGLLDLGVIHEFLTHSYWSEGIRRDRVERAIQNSLCFGLYEGFKQIGFARVITDTSSFAYMLDVFVLEDYQGKGLGAWLVECVLAHPDLRGVHRWMLSTRDAHGLYSKFGFTGLDEPTKLMTRQTTDSVKV